MAWRDSRRNQARLLLFMSSIIIGIAALVAINSFSRNMQQKINEEARVLLGADLEVESRQAIEDSIRHFFDSLQLQRSEEINFASMVIFPNKSGTRLVQVRAIEGNYPFYGALETTPPEAANNFRMERGALVDKSLLIQYNISPGDSIQVGNLMFRIAGAIEKVPGQASIASAIAPPVFIPKRYLEATGLLQKGSRINYKIYLKSSHPENFNELFEATIKPRLEATDLRYDTVEERKKEVGEAYADLTGFLNLVAFVALLLGCIGVASSVHIYTKEKVAPVAILRCLGVKNKEAFGIYLIQIAAIGLAGSITGAILGSLLQFFLPKLFAGLLPFEINLVISWKSIITGIITGLIISVLFTLLPLLRLRKVSPLTALRASDEEEKKDRFTYLIYFLIIVFIAGFALIQVQSLIGALYFTGGLIAAFLILTGIAQAGIWIIKRFFPSGWPYIWRQSLSNLFRPNNQTLILIVTIGLATTLITTLFTVQHLLLQKLELSGGEEQPNMVVFDIQPDQLEGVTEFTKKYNLPVIQKVPVITMRLQSIKGTPIEALKKDTTTEIRRWVLNREYRVTYRDTLIDSETVTEGKWVGHIGSLQDTVYISLSDNLARDMNVGIGDKITFNVQGVPLETYIGSIRKVDWQRVQTNFMIVFPEGVLEQAPKFYVLVTRADSSYIAARYRNALVQAYPTVSIIDLELILKTVDQILEKVSFVIRFMAFFSIATGLLVLIGSVMITKFQRIKESVLLRTLGGSRKQILSINTLEYFFLGSLASVTGIIISLLASWLLAFFYFNTPFRPPFLPLVLSYLAITGITMLIGLINSRSVVTKSPMEVLRSEV